MSCELPSGVRALGTPISNHFLCCSFLLSTLPRRVKTGWHERCVWMLLPLTIISNGRSTRSSYLRLLLSSHTQQHLYAYTHTWSIIIRITLERHFSSIYTWANNSSDWRLGERTVLFSAGGSWLVDWVVSCISLLYIILHWRDRDTQNLEYGHRANIYLGTGKRGRKYPS